jgi:hypothetical protein
MRIETYASGDNSAAQAAAAAAAAQSASRPHRTDPTHRAEAGWQLANKDVPAAAGPAAQAEANAGVNARTALNRTDLPPAEAKQVRTAVERLGNALVDGRIEPHVNDTFRQHLYSLATEPANSPHFRGALAQMTRAADVLAKVELATGTRLAYDPEHGQPGVKGAGLPILNQPNIDADLYFKTRDGVLHIEGVKATPQALSNEVQEASKRGAAGRSSQIGIQSAWAQGQTPGQPRSLSFFVPDKGPGFVNLMDDRRQAQLAQLVGGDPDARRFTIGDRAYSLNDFKQIAAAADAAAQQHVTGLQDAAAKRGTPFTPEQTKQAYVDFYQRTLSTTEAAAKNFGSNIGQQVDELKPLARPEGPSVRSGAAWGAAGAAAVTLVRVGMDGQLNAQDVKEIATHTALGAGVGALTAAGERVVTPVVDRAIGQTVQRAATAVAPRVLASATPEAAAAFGAGARTLAARVGGATVVGAAIATGISAYENREGLRRGDSKAIGNVAADATVAAGSIAAATAAGAAIGSVVPVAGTAVGAVVGLAVGVGVAYGAQISGARDAVANTVSGWVDGVKGWFR